jgi:hypothetical protein
MDTIVVSRNVMELNFDDMPPFHMGRYRWDPWVAGWLRAHVPVVALGDDFCAYHINHTPTLRDVSRPKVRENIEYAVRAGGYLGSNNHTQFVFAGREFVERGAAGSPLPKWIPKANAPEAAE